MIRLRHEISNVCYKLEMFTNPLDFVLYFPNFALAEQTGLRVLFSPLGKVAGRAIYFTDVFSIFF